MTKQEQKEEYGKVRKSLAKLGIKLQKDEFDRWVNQMGQELTEIIVEEQNDELIRAIAKFEAGCRNIRRRLDNANLP